MPHLFGCFIVFLSFFFLHRKGARGTGLGVDAMTDELDDVFREQGEGEEDDNGGGRGGNRSPPAEPEPDWPTVPEVAVAEDRHRVSLASGTFGRFAFSSLVHFARMAQPINSN
jgi:hypothetical protein